MLDAVRRWFGWGDPFPAWAELAAWAAAHQWTLKRTITRDGWVMNGHPGHPAWRIEWGPAQRSFMGRCELRVRLELADTPDQQALVLDRPLLARLDKEVYAQVTDHVQTRFDDETPEEMRWLAMHPKLSPNQVGVPLRDRYGAVGNDPAWVSAWLQGPLSDALKRRADATPVETAKDAPFALRLSRGHVVLRQAAKAPTVRAVEIAVDVAQAAEQALERARRG